jgi:hypothetical protein
MGTAVLYSNVSDVLSKVHRACRVQDESALSLRRAPEGARTNSLAKSDSSSGVLQGSERVFYAYRGLRWWAAKGSVLSILGELWTTLNLPAGDAIERFYRSKSKQWVADFAPPSCAPKLSTAAQNPLLPNQHYITVTAQKTVLPYDRVLLKSFYGAVHSTFLVHDDAGEPRSLTTFSSIDSTLTALDSHAGERLVQGPRTLLEFVPFRGTAIGSTLALLAVEAVDYAKPLLATLQKMSDVAGVKFFGGTAGVLAEPLIAGIQALSEASGGGGIQIVYAGNMPLRSGIFLLAAAESTGFRWSDYSFASDYTLLKDGMPVADFAYMVVTIETSTERPNWREIPELKEAEANLNAAITSAGRKISDPSSEERAKVENALLALQWACLNTPDLCEGDGGRIADQCKAKIQSYLSRATRGLESMQVFRHGGDRMETAFTLDDIDAFPRP